MNKAIEINAELRDYMRKLEAEYQKGKYEVGEQLGEDIIKEVENFLRQKSSEE